jgi:hypothetical protein
MPPTSAPPPSERRLDRAISHVSNLWFPINSEILLRIRKGLEEGRFAEDAATLIEELKQDFGLFSYVVKELLPIATKERVAEAVRANPIQLIRWAGDTRIQAIIGSGHEPPATHQLDASEEFQSTRLCETAIVASTAELLSHSQNLNPDVAFSQGIIREIGLNLIAWNYPSLYTRVIKTLTPRTSIDEELSKELGFSPSLLAVRLLRPHSIATPTNRPGLGEATENWEAYDHLCDIGEALARAGNPQLYPSAEADWKRANDYIRRSLGDNGVEQIRERASEHTEHYRAILPASFANLKIFDPQLSIERYKLGSRATQNPYLRHCPAELQTRLHRWYAEMPVRGVSREILQQLIKTIIPQAGFTGGCVFVVDAEAMSLLPRTVIGDVQLRPLDKIPLKSTPARSLVNQALPAETLPNSSPSSADPALAAFNCTQPLIEREELDPNNARAGIYSSLGTKRRVGVLYLEIPDEQLETLGQSAVKVYKALKQALCDALCLE